MATPPSPSLLVIGGGAAGVFSAISAAQASADLLGERSALRVVVAERQARPLHKVRISGGGRCNVTHSASRISSDGGERSSDHDGELARLLSLKYPRGFRELQGSFFREFGLDDTYNWFESRGVALKVEADGRVFPQSDRSQSIEQCLLDTAGSLGVDIAVNCDVKSVRRVAGDDEKGSGHRGRFLADFRQGQSQVFDYVVLATGSSPRGHSIASSLGHRIVEPRPSLFTFTVKDDSLTSMAGTSFASIRATLKVNLDQSLLNNRVYGGWAKIKENMTQDGPLLITHWGVSGPLVLKLSAWTARILYDAKYRGTLVVDFVPGLTAPQALDILTALQKRHPRKQLASVCPKELAFSKRFWTYLLSSRLNLSADMPWGQLRVKDINRIVSAIKKFEISVAGKGAFKEEFVTAGGVSLKEINLKSMESKVCPGLYCIGEVLNIDGLTGGFNFQSCWTAGHIAGKSIAESLSHR